MLRYKCLRTASPDFCSADAFVTLIRRISDIQFNLVYFCIGRYHKLQIFLRGLYNLYTRFLSQDLTSDQEKLPRNRKKNFHGRASAGSWQEASDTARSNRPYETSQYVSYINMHNDAVSQHVNIVY